LGAIRRNGFGTGDSLLAQDRGGGPFSLGVFSRGRVKLGLKISAVRTHLNDEHF
jgi:hypothetical protein